MTIRELAFLAFICLIGMSPVLFFKFIEWVADKVTEEQ